MLLLTLDELLKAAAQSEIASMGVVVNRILEVIRNPKSNAMELKALIEIDPALSALVLRRANSAYYGLKRKLTNILDAIVCLGFDTVKELALNQKVGQMFKRDQVVKGYSRQLLWIHSLAVALCGKLIYRREYRMRGDDIYTAGILHDFGILILDQFLKDDYLAILGRVQAEKMNLRLAEQEALGFTHEDLGGRLMQSWNLPSEFCEVVSLAERPDEASGELARLARILYVANVACQGRGLGFVEAPRISQSRYLACLGELNLNELAIRVIMDDVVQEIQKMKSDGWFE